MTPPARAARPGGTAEGWPADERDAAAHAFVGDAADLADDVVLDGPDGHHLQRVRRLRAGERLTLADGRGAWRAYEVEAVSPGSLQLGARGELRAEPDLVPRVALAVALTKAGALETVVARTTELGVARVVPLRTRRCVVRWTAADAERAVGRLRATAREAAAQSRRARLPEIAPVTDLAGIADRPGLVVADRSGAPARQLAAPGPVAGAPPEWIAVVGPEGGLDPDELAQLAHAPRVGLGPYVLKAETAPIAAAALLLDRAREMFREWQV